MAKRCGTASLVLYGKTDDGWRRGSIVLARNGQPKPGIMLISGQEVTATNGVYQIRRYADRRAVYVPVGPDYRTAQSLLERTQLTRQREAIDAQLGISVPKTAAELAAEAVAEAAEKAVEEAERQKQRKTLVQYAAEFMETKKGLSTDSIALVRDAVFPFISSTGKPYVEDLSCIDVIRWYNSLTKQYALRTCQTRYTTVRGFLRSCGVNVTTLIDAATHARLRKKPSPCTEPYTDEQIQRLFAVCDDYHRLAFALLLSTGLRYREASHLTWRQIQWENNQIIVEGKQEIHHKTGKVVRFKTKSGRSRMVPLFASLRALLEDWRRQHPDTIYVLGTHTRDLPDNHWLGKLTSFARLAGLNCGVCAGCAAKNRECEQFYLHKFRHSYAYRCLEKFSIHQLSKWMGHHDLSVTSIYLSGTPKDADCDPFAPAPAPNARPSPSAADAA